jgi:hypothetical protein
MDITERILIPPCADSRLHRRPICAPSLGSETQRRLRTPPRSPLAYINFPFLRCPPVGKYAIHTHSIQHHGQHGEGSNQQHDEPPLGKRLRETALRCCYRGCLGSVSITALRKAAVSEAGSTLERSRMFTSPSGTWSNGK